jgi:hypothetical protein
MMMGAAFQGLRRPSLRCGLLTPGYVQRPLWGRHVVVVRGRVGAMRGGRDARPTGCARCTGDVHLCGLSGQGSRGGGLHRRLSMISPSGWGGGRRGGKRCAHRERTRTLAGCGEVGVRSGGVAALHPRLATISPAGSRRCAGSIAGAIGSILRGSGVVSGGLGRLTYRTTFGPRADRRSWHPGRGCGTRGLFCAG